MCGIFAYYSKHEKLTDEFIEELKGMNKRISHRGPDSTQTLEINNQIFLGFHRLAINGLDASGNQPMEMRGVYLICNGEIFNYKKLIKELCLEDDYKSASDCEIILHLYHTFGIDVTCQLLDGEFAFVLYDSNKDIVYIARDQLGIRALYWNGNDKAGSDIWVSSELKGLCELGEKITQFPVATYWSSDSGFFTKFYDFEKSRDKNQYEDNEEIVIFNIKSLFESAVRKRLMSERKIACLLSGGLDSTTVTALVARDFPPYTVNTYSIGMKGSVDLHYAQMAADYFKTNHKSIELSSEEFLEGIIKTIKQIESYDTTTVRASVGNYLISLYIRENTDDTVIFCGDVSDEIFASYRGFYYAPNDEALYYANVNMLNNIQYFDVLRSDKSISGAGLEARVPFSDKKFLTYCMQISPGMKHFNQDHIEKYLFRRAFEDILPPELAWRVKTAFSDGVSNAERPWYEIIKEYMDTKYTDDEYEEKRLRYTHNMPYDKESLYYREVYEVFYPGTAETIPYFWKQPFMGDGKSDPSAWCVEKEIK
jgi:asparagine synthase (glutamine-hydrolysing)